MLKSEKNKRIKRSSILCQFTINSSHLLICHFFLAEHFYLSKLLIKCLLLNININLNVLFFFRPFQLNHQWKNECKSSVKNAMKLIETLNGRNSRLKNLIAKATKM